MPADSKMDLLLAKKSQQHWQHLCDNKFKKGKKTCSGREECEYLRARTLQTPRSVKKKDEEVLQVPEQIFPSRPWRRPWWGRLSPSSPWRSMMEQISTCSPWRTPDWSRWMPEGDCDHAESPHWSRLLARICGLWRERRPCWSRFVGRTCDPVDRTHAGAVHEELQPVGSTHLGGVYGGLSTMGESPHWSRGRVWEVLPLRRKERRDEVWWTDRNPNSLLLLFLSRGGGREIGSEVEPRKKGGMGGRCFKV